MAFKDPARTSCMLLTAVQDGATYRFTDWSDEVTTDAGTFDPLPGLEIRLPPNTGTLEEKPLSIEFPLGLVDLFDDLCDGSVQAPVTLKLEERTHSIGPINTTACGTQAQKITFGSNFRLVRAVRNADRRAGVGRFEFLSTKGRLFIPLGIAATPRCAWTLGDKTCQVVVNEETGTVSAISRKKLTLTSPADAAIVGRPTKYWHRGVARIGELRIGIRDWVGGSYDFELLREPPASWVGATVTLRPGCDKTAAVCDARWSNLARFGGFGIAIPAHQVVLEVP